MKITLVVIVTILFQIQLLAKVSEVIVCGRHTVSNGRQFLLVKSDVLEKGNYILFASSPVSKKRLSILKNGLIYRVKGGFDFSRPEDGINLRSAVLVKKCSI